MLGQRYEHKVTNLPADPLLTRIRSEGKALLVLGLPIMATQLLQNGLSMVDVIMAGNASAEDLAGVSLGGAIYIPLMLFVTGMIVVLSALVSHASGAGEPEKATAQTHQAAWLGLVAGLFGWFLCQQGDWLLALVSVGPVVKTKAVGYLAAVGYSLPALGLYQALRSFCEGYSRTRAVMIMTGLGFAANIPVDYALVFGLGPFPALGGVGCGWATSAVCWLLVLMVWLYTRYSGARGLFPSLYERWVSPSREGIGHLMGLGVPIALAIFFETSLFSVTSMLIARYGAVTLAGHQIAYNLSATTYMVPLALGVAISVRCGYFLGRRQPDRARFSCLTGIGFAGVIAVLFAVVLFLFRHVIVGWFSQDPQVETVAASLLTMAAIFQISDGFQASTSGALRGYQDTRAIMAATLAAYWGLGLPLGYCLAQGIGGLPALGVRGYWWGLIIGLSAAALFLVARLLVLSQRHAQTPSAHTPPR